MTNYSSASLDESTRVLLDYAAKLTRSSSSASSEDVAVLRGQGFSDRAIHDAVQIVAYFNYINRIADGLGVDLEPDMPRRECPPSMPDE